MSRMYLRGLVSPGRSGAEGLEFVPHGKPLRLQCREVVRAGVGVGLVLIVCHVTLNRVSLRGLAPHIFRARRNAAHSDVQPTHSSGADAAPSTASRARAFTRVSSISSAATESAVMPPPVPMLAPSGVSTIDRIDHREVGAAVDRRGSRMRPSRCRAGPPRARAGSSWHCAWAHRSSTRPGTPPARRRAR